MAPEAGGAPCGWTESPAAALERAFSRIQRERMRDVPILNPRLRVEAVGFQRFQGHWIGVLVTPWFMNALVLPGAGVEWPARGTGDAHAWPLPIGNCEFIAGYEEEVGEYHLCSLISPVLEFADHDTARMTANLALEALLKPAVAPEPPAREALPKLDEPVDRRGFLGGRFLGGRGE